jgi:hypothetical protein
MADLSEFEGAEAGLIRKSVPTVRFDFKPGEQVGVAEFVIEGAGEAQDELNRWAALMLGVGVGTMEILEVLEVRAWGRDPDTGEPYRYVKARVSRRDENGKAELLAAERWLSRHPRKQKARPVGKPAGKPKSVTKTSCGMWWPVTDTQLGKGGEERFGGVSETMARLDWAADEFVAWAGRQKKAGYQPDRIVIPLGGDMTEGCHGSYDNQQFITSLNAADQLELAIAATERIVDRALDAAPEVILTGVASNHDRQSRMSSKENITDAWDDRTFVLLRTLARVYDRAGFDRVQVVMPANPHVSVIDDGHLIVATIHGHKPKYRGTAANTMWEWWKSEIAARRDAAAAHVLLTAHYHHAFTLGPQSGRMLIGLPSLDGGSAFFEATGGDWSLPGIRPFLTTVEGVAELDTLVWPHDREQARQQVGGLVA